MRPKREREKKKEKKKTVMTDIQKKNIFKIWKEPAPDDACFFSQFCHQYYYEQ